MFRFAGKFRKGVIRNNVVIGGDGFDLSGVTGNVEMSNNLVVGGRSPLKVGRANASIGNLSVVMCDGTAAEFLIGQLRVEIGTGALRVDGDFKVINRSRRSSVT